MRIIRKILLIIFTIVLIILVSICFRLTNKEKLAMNSENITIVKAPEQTEAMEHPDFLVKEFIPVLPEGINIATQGKVEVSSFADVYTGIKTIDGKLTGTSYWEGAADSYPNILTVNLKDFFDISAVRVCINPDVVWGSRTQTFSLLVSNDGIAYIEIIAENTYEFNPDTGNQVILDFENITCQYVQLQFTDNSGSNGAQVAEFEIYSNS